MNTPLHILQNKTSEKIADLKEEIIEDEFLNEEELFSFKRDAAERRLREALLEIDDLIRQKRWEDAVSIFYPVNDKLPELLKYDLDMPIREKLGFILGQLNRFDEAIKELNLCIQKDPNNFLLRNSLAYTAYNSLYAAKNQDIFLSGKAKEDRIKLAHRHFQEAQRLRPDGVTNYYREGMLYKQLENKDEKALPLFQKAVANWDALSHGEKEARHQERKNFVKALFQLSSTQLRKGRGREALDTIKRCLTEDEKSGYLSLVFKYFALGKVNFHLGLFPQAKDALLFALKSETRKPMDFVNELLARTYLALGNSDRAMEIIQQVPEKKRRPYYRWTEADVWCDAGDFKKAKHILIRSQEADRRSKHKALIRLAKIEYLLQNFEDSLKHAEKACRFFNEKWGNVYDDGLFWQALNYHRLGNNKKARGLAQELKDSSPRYPKLDLLMKKLTERKNA